MKEDMERGSVNYEENDQTSIAFMGVGSGFGGMRETVRAGGTDADADADKYAGHDRNAGGNEAAGTDGGCNTDRSTDECAGEYGNTDTDDDRTAGMGKGGCDRAL